MLCIADLPSSARTEHLALVQLSLSSSHLTTCPTTPLSSSSQAGGTFFAFLIWIYALWPSFFEPAPCLFTFTGAPAHAPLVVPQLHLPLLVQLFACAPRCFRADASRIAP
jgi:hypothetical protein